MGDTPAQVDHLYYVEEVSDRTLFGVVPKKRRIVNPFARQPTEAAPGLFDMQTYLRLKAKLAERTGYEALATCVTGEMAGRPVPDVTDGSTYRRGAEIFAKWLPYLMDEILPRTRRQPFSFNAKSKVGSPVSHRIADKAKHVWPMVTSIMTESGAREFLRDKYTTVGVRLQVERPNKVRKMRFVNAAGYVREQDIGPEDRMKQLYGMWYYLSRTRTTFNPPLTNTGTQAVDNVIGSGLYTFASVHHEMFASRESLNVIPRGLSMYMATDVRHLDHFLGACVRILGEYVGGIYNAVMDATLARPFIVPSDDWTTIFWLYALGVVQLPSGISNVSILGKLFFLANTCEAVQTLRRLEERDIARLILNGGDTRFTIRNSGDDNLVGGERKDIEWWYAAMSEVCEMEVEEPMRFLGFIFDPALHTFELREKSYLDKSWNNEREMGPPFRPFPALGWVERRRAYHMLGNPERMSRLFEIENDVLREGGVEWRDIEEVAELERRDAEAGWAEEDFGPEHLTDKDYLLTPEEKLGHPNYTTIPEPRATAFVRSWVGPEFERRLYLDQSKV